tara:strand:+ start:1314 stop:1679 length:366 start_codon:yes stop_codon:yes gene_type:complete
MPDSEAVDRLLLILDTAKGRLATESVENVLLRFVEEVDDLWVSIHQQNFFNAPILDGELPEDGDINECIVCGDLFVNELTEEELKNIDEDKINYPMMEAVRICKECYGNLGYRMPDQANLN